MAVVKGFYRGPRFKSQHHIHGRSQTSVTPVPEYPMLIWPLQVPGTHMRTKHIGKINKSFFLRQVHIRFQRLWQHVQDLHNFKPDKTPVRRGGGHQVSCLTKKLSASDVCWEKENQFSPVEWRYITQTLRQAPGSELVCQHKTDSLQLVFLFFYYYFYFWLFRFDFWFGFASLFLGQRIWGWVGRI